MQAGSKQPPEIADAVLTPMSALDASVPVLSQPLPGRSLAGVVRKLASRSVLALTDQAIVSVGNFVSVVLVGGFLADASQVGAFTNLLEVWLFLNGLQQALVIYPLLVRGASMSEDDMRRLSGGCLLVTTILCIPLMLVMLATAAAVFFFGKSVHFSALPLFIWAPLALLFQQLQETLRRTLLAHLRFAAALPGDAVSYLLQAVILLLLRHHLTLPTIFAVLTLTSAAAAVIQYIQIRPHWFRFSGLKALVADFWTLSRWMLSANLGALVTGNSYTWMLTFSAGLGASGYFGVIANLAKPVNPLTTALSGLIIPSVSRARAAGGTRFAMRIGLRYAVLGLVALSIYFGLLALFPAWSLLHFYKAHPEYSQKLAGYLRILVCAWTLLFITNMTLAILNGLGYSRANFMSTLANMIVTVVISLPLIHQWGLKGTIIGGFIATASATVVAVYSFIKHQNDAVPPAAAGGS
jgi:O-antigen/teichoic acid export membrane protein